MLYAKDYENTVRCGLNFLCFIAEEYIRLEDTDIYLADLDKQIKHHTFDYKRLVNDEYFDQLSSLFRFEELGKLLIKRIAYMRRHGRENEVDSIMVEYKFVLDDVS